MWDAVVASLPELERYMPWAIDPSFENEQEFLRRAEQEWEADQAWSFVIRFAGQTVGTIGLGDHIPVLRSAHLGYWIRSDLAGRGLTTEAAAAVVDFAFDDLELHRIELHAALDNVGSIRVAEKLGFRRAGILRHAGRGAHGYHDVYVFDLLDTDERVVVPMT